MENVDPKLTEAFEHWLDAQRQAIELVLGSDHPGSPEDVAEGHRWVTRIASLALDYVVEKGDPLRPVLFHAQDEYRKLLVDNPDVNYYFAVLDDRETYVLRGNRGEAPYLGFTLGTDIFRPSQGGRTGTLSQTYIDQFEVAPNGDFEIVVSPERPASARNWIRLAPGTQHIAVRETFYDKRTQAASRLAIARSAATPPPRCTPDVLARQLEDAAVYLLFIVRTGIMMWAGANTRLNQIVGASGKRHVEAQDDQVRSHSDTDMVYMGGRYRLEAGQALVANIQPPSYDFVYWGLVLVNPWMESFDYRHRTIHTNNHLAAKDPDGSWTIVIGAEDPGRPNWLDTGGRREGFLLLRWVLAGDAPPTPTCRVVDAASLRPR
jgi:hypothetical protein